MTVPCYGKQALALFGHEEDAILFLRSSGTGGSSAEWWIRESRCGEVASVLYGPCASAERVVLDPPPGSVANGTAALASVDRFTFVASLLATDVVARSSGLRGTSRSRRAGRRTRKDWGTGPGGRAQEKLG